MLKEMLQIMSKLSRLLSLNLEHVLLFRYENIQSPVRCSQRIFKKTVSSLLMTVFLFHRQEDLFHCFGLRDPTLDTNQYLC